MDLLCDGNLKSLFLHQVTYLFLRPCCRYSVCLCLCLSVSLSLSLSVYQSGFPYVAVFLRKDPEWDEDEAGDGSEEGATAAGTASTASTADDSSNDTVAMNGDAVEGAVQQTYPEVITSLDEIHEVGTLAQVGTKHLDL